MKKQIILLPLILTVLRDTNLGATQTSAVKAPQPHELALQGKIQQAVQLANKSPNGVTDTLQTLFEMADIQVTDQKIAEAQTTLEAASKFLDAYAKDRRSKPVSREALKGRQLRLQGIQLSNKKEYEKAEVPLKDALEIARKIKDPTLEAGAHNNLGYALLSRGREEEACKEFTAAREMAEAQKDPSRSSSYNFNLGLSLYQMHKWDQALDAFKRSAEQSRTVSKASLEARAIMWEGRALSNINAVSPEATKYFASAQKMFEKLGDQGNSGRSYMLAADHTAYSLDFARAIVFAEQAIAPLTAAGDKTGLRDCYSFLADMYGRIGKKEKVEMYKKKANEIDANKPPQ